MVTVLEVLAAMLTTGCWVPQLVRTLRTRSAHDFSWGYLTMLGTGLAACLTYGALQADAAIVLANIFVLIFIGAIVLVKAAYGRPRRSPLPLALCPCD